MLALPPCKAWVRAWGKAAGFVEITHLRVDTASETEAYRANARPGFRLLVILVVQTCSSQPLDEPHAP